MINSIKEIIKKYQLIEEGDRVLVGLSGGADSMCLVHVLCSLADEFGISVAAAHMNHNIRGEEAKSDALKAEAFAKRLGIKFHIGSENVTEIARFEGISEELAGRKVRYEFFGRLQKEYGYTKIATAHNKNDNAETLIMNFMRGSTTQGLCGIPVKRDDIIRPLLYTGREEIEEYCDNNGIQYVIDCTNKETIYTRNKIRLKLIPEIESEFNANFIGTVTKNAELINDENDYIASSARTIYNKYVKNMSAPVDMVNKEHIALVRRVFMYMIADASGSNSDVSSIAVEDIIRLCKAAKSGKSIMLPGGISAAVEYDRIIISKSEEVDEFEYILKLNEDVLIHELNVYARLEKCESKDEKGAIYFSADEAAVISLRNRRSGDKFNPSGMQGSKKVKNLFIDEKIPKSARMSVPIITADNKIACVGTLRNDSAYEFGKNDISFKVKLIQTNQEENTIGT